MPRRLIHLVSVGKGKISLVISSALFFLFVLFPMDDLSDLISMLVSKTTNNGIYLQFEKLKMSFFPQPGISMNQVFIETLRTPALTAQELVITPSIRGLIQQKPFGHVSAKGLLKGDIDLDVGGGSRSDAGIERHRIGIKIKKLSLHDLRELINLPVLLKGQLNLDTMAMADLTFQEQPNVEFIDLKINQFELPPSNLETAMGPLTLPELKLSSIEIKGKLEGGRFIIETGTIGKPGDDLFGTIKGDIGISILNQDGIFTKQIGGYTFEIDLNAKKSFQDRATLFLSFIDGYKTPTEDGAKYKFKATATNPLMPPSLGQTR